MRPPRRAAAPVQRGVVLILVLWFLIVAILLVGVLAREVRLSADAVFQNKAGVDAWAATLQALNVAEMELLVQHMPPEQEASRQPLGERENPLFQFDGRKLQPAYPLPPEVVLRIYDHAGKINLQNLNVEQFRDLLKKHVGDDPDKVNALYDAWLDWKDADDLKRLNGAEKDYYQHQDPPYAPRNGNLESVGEVLLIKGFAEVFAEVNLDAVFTIYGSQPGVNPNLANPDTLALLPGLDDAAIAEILTRRQERAFRSLQDFAEFLLPDQLTAISRWVNFSTTPYYTIAIQRRHPQDQDATPVPETASGLGATAQAPEETPEESGAYMVTVMFRGYNQPPKVLRVDPYGRLPKNPMLVAPPEPDKKRAKKSAGTATPPKTPNPFYTPKADTPL